MRSSAPWLPCSTRKRTLAMAIGLGSRHERISGSSFVRL
jgi:hypothetical protein